MLTDLSFLNIGQVWPPLSEYERLEMYRHNKALFEGEHIAEYAEAFKRIERVIGNFDEVVSFAMVVNYQKLMSLKVADLLFGEAPKITAGDSGSKEQMAVDTIIKNTDLFNVGYENTLDVSRFGNGLLYVYKHTDKGSISVSQPPMWFPVVADDDIKRFTHHVLAWTYNVGEAKFLRVRVHEQGFYNETIYLLGTATTLSGWVINSVSVPTKKFETGMSDFSVIPVSNVITSDRVFGIDDYSDLDSMISELLVRLGQISRILDKHASPSVTGPTSSLERDPVTSEWKLKMGNFFVRDGREDAEVKYLTWDGQLEANFKMIEQIINFLHAISEMGGQLLGDTNQDGGALSGTALRFKMVSPLSKVKRIAMRFKPALEKAIVLCSQLGGEGIVDLSKTPISINFQDGLPNDPKEEADIMSVRTGNKATMSVQRALQVYDGMSSDDAESEVMQIQEEEATANPMLSQSTPFNGNNDPNATGGRA